MTPLAQDRLEQLLADTLTRHETLSPTAHRLPDGVRRREQVHRRRRRVRLAGALAVAVVAGGGGLVATRGHADHRGTRELPAATHPAVLVPAMDLPGTDPTTEAGLTNPPPVRDHRFTGSWSLAGDWITVAPPAGEPRLTPQLALGLYAASSVAPPREDLQVVVAFGDVTLRQDPHDNGRGPRFVQRPEWVVLVPQSTTRGVCDRGPVRNRWLVLVIADDIPTSGDALRLDPSVPDQAMAFGESDDSCIHQPMREPVDLLVSQPWELVSQERHGVNAFVRVRGRGRDLCLPGGVHAEAVPDYVLGAKGTVDAFDLQEPVPLMYVVNVTIGSGAGLECAPLPEATADFTLNTPRDIRIVPGGNTLARFAD